jgi:formamidopyrimidine-DNA glycosylase
MSGNIREYPTPEILVTYNTNRKLNGKKPESLEQYLKHCHIKFSVSSNSDLDDITYIMYHDVRRFGRLVFSDNPNELQTKLKTLGTDPLKETISDEAILKNFRLRNHKNICKALMDNDIICNVGNYICNETNYRAKIYPLARIIDIPDEALLDLYQQIIKIGKDAYNQQGASLYTYSGIKGEQSNFKEQLLVYGHEGEKDPNGYTIVRIPADKSPDKRSIFWVPEVQIIGKPVDITPKKKLVLKKVVPVIIPKKKILVLKKKQIV